MQNFVDQTAAITGAASGIGLAMARTFAAEGIRLALADIEQPALHAAAEALRADGAQVLDIAVDVSDSAAVERFAEAAYARFGAVDILCNNAGVLSGGCLWECSLADYQWQLNVNVWGVVHGIRSFVPRMIAQDSECHIVNTASMAALTAMPFSGIYHMTKHAVLGMSESLYKELALRAPQIKVSVLCPEMIDTGIGHAERNRPEELRGAGDVTDTEESRMVVDSLRQSMRDEGMAPSAMSERTLQAIRDERFYILPPQQNGWRRIGNVRLDEIRDGKNPSLQVP